MQYTFKKSIVRAGIPDICIHELRHSAATMLLKMEVEMKVIQRILGHSDYTITANIYGPVLIDMQQDAMGKLDNRFGEM
ncbi:MAG TPA: tyrosine-type recombinase/integrase [Ktedonobacteraceae bacterium]